MYIFIFGLARMDGRVVGMWRARSAFRVLARLKRSVRLHSYGKQKVGIQAM